jgi:hypothetical protein
MEGGRLELRRSELSIRSGLSPVSPWPHAASDILGSRNDLKPGLQRGPGCQEWTLEMGLVVNVTVVMRDCTGSPLRAEMSDVFEAATNQGQHVL